MLVGESQLRQARQLENAIRTTSVVAGAAARKKRPARAMWHHPPMLNPATAQRIATAAHEGQVDKSGAPYISHPQRIAERVGDEVGIDHPAVAVAWLHDVLEDTDVTMADLRVGGLDDAQATALEALTHHHAETREAYIERIRQNEIALIVKRADIADNSDPGRLARLAPETAARLQAKYARDLAQLASGIAGT